MKKKIFFGSLGLLTIVCAVLLFTTEVPTPSVSDNSGSITEQDNEPSGEGMIWELSRHFMMMN